MHRFVIFMLFSSFVSAPAWSADKPTPGAYRNTATNAVRYVELDGDTLHWLTAYDASSSITYDRVSSCARFSGEVACYRDDSPYAREFLVRDSTSLSFKNADGVASHFELVSSVHRPMPGPYRNVATNTVRYLEMEDDAILWKNSPDAAPSLIYYGVDNCARFGGKHHCFQDSAYYRREIFFRDRTSFSYKNTSGVESQFVLEAHEGAYRNIADPNAPVRYIDADADKLYLRHSVDGVAVLTYTYDSGPCKRFEGKYGCYRDPAPHYREIYRYDAYTIAAKNNSGIQTDLTAVSEDTATFEVGPTVIAPLGWRCATPQCMYFEELVCDANDEDAPPDQSCTEPVDLVDDEGVERAIAVFPRGGDTACALNRLMLGGGEDYCTISQEYTCTHDCDDFAYEQCVALGWDHCRVLAVRGRTGGHAVNVITYDVEGEDYYCLWEPSPDKVLVPWLHLDCWPADENGFEPPDDILCSSQVTREYCDAHGNVRAEVFDSCVDGEDYWWEDPYDNPVEVLKTCAAWNDRTKGRLKMHPDVPDCEQLESDSGFADTCSPDETMVCKETDPETGGDTCRLKTCESVRSCYEDIYYWVDYGADAVPYCDPEFGTFDDTFKGDICPNEYNLKNGECSDYDAWWLRSFNTKYCKTVDAAGDEYLHPVSCTKPKKRFGIFGSRYFQWELGEGQRIEDVSFLDDYSDCWSDTGF